MRVQHDLAHRERHAQTTRRSSQSSLRLVRAAVELTTWASAHGLTLGQVRQEDLDRWLQDGSSTTASIRPFLRWAARGGLIAPLTAARVPARSHIEPVSHHERLGVVRRLLAGDDIDLRDRVAGCLILIYAQPLSCVLGLRVADVVIDGDRVRIALGSDPVQLPEPLAQLTASLARRPSGRASTAVAGVVSPWLFPGMGVGQPLDRTQATKRLRRVGVRPLTGRTGAIITLAGALPPTILAELLGVSETTASKWYRLARGEWNRYAAATAVSWR